MARGEIPDQVLEVDAERRQIRKEKANGKGKSKKYQQSRSKYRKMPIFLTHECDSVFPSTITTSPENHDRHSKHRPCFPATAPGELPATYKQSDLLLVGSDTTSSQENSSIYSSSTSDESSWDEEFNCFIPPPYLAAYPPHRALLLNTHTISFSQSRMVDKLMEYFHLKLSVDWQNASPKRYAPSSTSNATSNQSSAGRPKDLAKKKGTKRSRDKDEDQNSDNESGEGCRRPEGPSTAKEIEGITPLFACPYRKRNPKKYCVRDWGPCALTGQKTTSRVK